MPARRSPCGKSKRSCGLRFELSNGDQRASGQWLFFSRIARALCPSVTTALEL